MCTQARNQHLGGIRSNDVQHEAELNMLLDPNPSKILSQISAVIMPFELLVLPNHQLYCVSQEADEYINIYRDKEK